MMETTTRKPKLRDELIIGVEVIVVIVAAISKIICPVTAPSWLLMALSLVETFGLFALVISFITLGIRCFRQKCCYLKGAVLLMLGLSINIFNLYVIYVSGSYIGMLSQRPNIELIKQSMNNPGISKETKIKLSNQYAHNRYLYDGVIEKYFTESGEMQEYKPSSDDKKFREELGSAKQMLSSNRIARIWPSLQWFLVTLFGLLLGFFTPIKRRSAS